MPTPEELKYFVALRDVIAGKMGDVWKYGERWFVYNGELPLRCYTFGVGSHLPRYDIEDGFLIIRLPLPIDPENPERGLWGMIDWYRFFVRFRANGKMNIQCQDFVVDDYPTLALLKALAWQEGVEVR
jgi:hypothetical protein